MRPPAPCRPKPHAPPQAARAASAAGGRRRVLTPLSSPRSDPNLVFVESPALKPPEVAIDQSTMQQYEQELHAAHWRLAVAVHADVWYVDPAEHVVHAVQTRFWLTTPPAWQAVVSYVDPA